MATPIPAANTSKNQRSGPRSKAPVRLCDKGHNQTWVNYAARGRKRMELACECTGYMPIGKN